MIRRIDAGLTAERLTYPTYIFSFSARGSTVVRGNTVPAHIMKEYGGSRGMPLLILYVTSSQLDAPAALTPNDGARWIGGWVNVPVKRNISCHYRIWNPD